MSYHHVLNNMHVHKNKDHCMCFFYISCFVFTCSTNCPLWNFDCYVILATLFWWCWRLCLSLLYNIYCTHTWCCKHGRASIIAVIWMSIPSVTLVARTYQSITLSVCCLHGSRCLVIESCWVCVRKVMHAQVHSITHLFILLKLYRPNLPLIIRPLLSYIA